MSYINTQEIYFQKVRVKKEDSAFFYFTLEACDNMCFYSTLAHETGQTYRDIEVRCTIDFKQQVDNLIDKLSQGMPVEILKQEIKKEA